MYHSVLVCLLAFLLGTFKISAQQVAADPAISAVRFAQNNSTPVAGPYPKNTSYSVLINLKNNTTSSAIPQNGFSVVVQLGKGLRFDGTITQLSSNYSWTIDSLFDPSQTIVRGVLRNTASPGYNEDILIPVRTVNGCISNNQLLAGININSSIIVNGNDFLNDDVSSQYTVFTPPDAGCIGGNQKFNAGIIGLSYQWQVSNGSGYLNVVDNATYAGASTSSLTIQNLSGSYTGYNYRCAVQTGAGLVYSPAQTVQFKNSWNGLKNSDWYNGSNWSCCQIPDQNTNVIIAPAINSPQLNGGAAVRKLTLLTGASLTVKTGGNLEISERN